jgi:hypothetical protein
LLQEFAEKYLPFFSSSESSDEGSGDAPWTLGNRRGWFLLLLGRRQAWVLDTALNFWDGDVLLKPAVALRERSR